MTDLIKRDHLIFVGVMGLISVGLTDGLHRGLGVPWWGAVPLGLGTWGGLATLTYRHYRKRMAQARGASEETGA